ncbi:MAG: DNA-binding protein WhiA, partial [Clostridia bacterium]|nr:DNA-binding protein WhiA [Clostridia bacterium]
TIADILQEFNIFAKTIKRKNNYVLYVKESSQVSDILALVGAFDSVFELTNEMAKRDIRNKVNRQNICETANISKIVEASIRQTKAIKSIQELFGLENLPDELQNVALLRLANPEESLDDLLKLSKLPFTKSGLNYRFKKLEKIAEKLTKKG